MTVRSFLRDPARPVMFLPVYFGYERIFEGSPTSASLSGKPKEKESVFGLLRALPRLRERFGQVHVNLGEPIELASSSMGSTPTGARAPSKTTRACRGSAPRWMSSASTSCGTSMRPLP